VVASGRSLPLAMCGVAAPVLVIMNCTLPPNSAVSAGASPANGTCTALFWASPARWSKLIVAKWCGEP
jgi:hypothetical protein